MPINHTIDASVQLDVTRDDSVIKSLVLSFLSSTTIEFAHDFREIAGGAVDELLPFGGIDKGKFLAISNHSTENLEVKLNSAAATAITIAPGFLALVSGVDIATLYVSNPNSNAVSIEFFLAEEAPAT